MVPPMKMIKKQWVVAVVLLLLTPLVLVFGGALFSLINPEIAAGHPNYERNFQLLNLLKKTVMWATADGPCFQAIHGPQIKLLNGALAGYVCQLNAVGGKRNSRSAFQAC